MCVRWLAKHPPEPNPPEPGVIEPIDLWGRLEPPALPTGLLPDVIEEEGALMGADPAGLAVGALAKCAAALPDHTKIQVKRHDLNWYEAARLWAALIGDPSRKKSPIILRVTKALRRLDTKLWREYCEALAAYEALSTAEKKNAKPPRHMRLRIEDTTMEAAQEIARDNPDGLLCIQPALTGWFGGMDKYSGRGRFADRAKREAAERKQARALLQEMFNSGK